MALDGFDSKTGQMDEKTWLEIIAIIREKLELSPNKRLLEVGCGSGAILFPLSKFVKKIVGVDYSKSLIKVAHKILPSTAVVLISDAKALPLADSMFDSILSYSVFFYFPNLDYAENVLKELIRISKPHSRILLMDIPDESKKTESEKHRIELIGEEEYRKRYHNLQHLYYQKEWFLKFSNDQSLGLQIFDQKIKGYGNSPYRFNVLLNKNYT